MVAEKVDKGSMAGFLAIPVTRSQITISGALYFVLSLMMMWGIASMLVLYLRIRFNQMH